MRTKIFISLPVADLSRSLAFFKALGYSNNPQFCDATAACIVISEEIHVMAVTFEKWRTFTPKAICDTSKAAEVAICLSCESRQEVIDLVAKAAAAGGVIDAAPSDHGFMYQHGFDDPDGHHWELCHMSAMPPKS